VPIRRLAKYLSRKEIRRSVRFFERISLFSDFLIYICPVRIAVKYRRAKQAPKKPGFGIHD
jgi:hypothetical protein